MAHRLANRLSLKGALPFVLAFLSGIILAVTHQPQSIVSFDEGFHLGAANATSILFSEPFSISLQEHKQNFAELSNGVKLYPPSWMIIAGFFGALFGPSLEVFRAASTAMYVAAQLLVFFFLRKVGASYRASLVAQLLLATTPLVAIYSNIAVREGTLLLGVATMVITSYLFLEGHLPKKWSTILLFLAWGFGAWTKLPALPVATAIIVAYVAASAILFPKEKVLKKAILSPLPLAILFGALILYLYDIAVYRIFGSSMIGFFSEQSSDMMGASENSSIITDAWRQRKFYLRDGQHYPLMHLIWPLSLTGYAVLKRNRLSALLATWSVGTYFAFSAVLPQVPQYILPIYVPLAISIALFIDELGRFFSRYGGLFFWSATTGIILYQSAAFSLSEGYGWRTKEVGNDLAAYYVAQQDPAGTVLTWHDGTHAAVRLHAPNMNIVSIRGNVLCIKTWGDPVRWAIVTPLEYPQITPGEREMIAEYPWKLAADFGATQVYENERATRGESAPEPLCINDTLTSQETL
jgi:hypothetical protein